MARFMEPTAEQLAGWHAWVAARPAHVRAVAQRFDPWSLYRLKTSGHRVVLASFGEQEDGGVSLTVSVTGRFNCVVFDRYVFGIDPEELEPCELPAPDEPVGTALTATEFHEHLPAIRDLMARRRPH
jgi:hypothetical protein